MKSFKSEILGKRIKEQRIVWGLSQTQLANKIGVDQTVVARYESGSANPSLKVLFQLAQIFSTTTDYLIGLTDFE